jgi:hypothetical protein
MDAISQTSGKSTQHPSIPTFEEWCKWDVNPSPSAYFDHLVSILVNQLTGWKGQREKCHE